MLRWEEAVYRRYLRRGLTKPTDPDVLIFLSHEGHPLLYCLHTRIKAMHDQATLETLLHQDTFVLTQVGPHLQIGRRKLQDFLRTALAFIPGFF